MKRSIFDDWKSWLHFLAGLLCAFIPFLIILTLIFMGYQIREEEEQITKIGDFVEFLFGFTVGLQLLMLLLLF